MLGGAANARSVAVRTTAGFQLNASRNLELELDL